MTSEAESATAATRAEVLVREVLPAPEGDPVAFLWAVGPGPRGFFGPRADWVAHAGCELGVGPGSSVSEGPPGSARVDLPPRYREVERARARLEEADAWEAPDAAPAPRLHGGFAFHPGHRAEGEWEGFPSVRFVLPRYELHGGDGDDPVLVGQRLVPSTDAGAREEAVSELRTGLHALREAMARSATRGGTDDGVAAPLHAEGGVDRSRWVRAVEDVLEAIRRGEVSKAVPARVLDVRSEPAGGAPGPLEVLERLRASDPDARVFLWEPWEPRPGRALAGAAPEVLASLRDGRFHATAVAGSAPVGGDAEERRLRADELRDSWKDRMEHRCTVEDMVARLEGRVTPLERDPEPRVLALPRIQHLETRIGGTAAEGESALSLVAALHPTPAVCGLPRDRALELLGRQEPFRRGWYAGPVGWVGRDGDGEFVPALRSAVGGPDGWRLFAGAGVVEGSDPGLEWEETGMKFEPMLRALGVEPRE